MTGAIDRRLAKLEAANGSGCIVLVAREAFADQAAVDRALTEDRIVCRPGDRIVAVATGVPHR